MIKDLKLRILAITAALLILIPLFLSTASRAEDISVAMVTCIKKELLVTHRGKQNKGKVGMELFEGDMLKTGPGCQAAIILGDGSELKLNQNTEITLTHYNEKKKSIFVQMGEIFGKFLPQKTKVNIETPQGVAGIEGTELSIKVDNEKKTSDITVKEGKVKVGDKGNIKVENGQLPPWVDDIREYGALLKDIYEGHNKIDLHGDKLKDISVDKLETVLKKQKEILVELQQVKPPDKLEKIHENLKTAVSQSINALETGIDCKKNPGNRALVQKFRRERGQFAKSWFNLAKEVKTQMDALKGDLEKFKKNYALKTGQDRR